MNKTYWKGVFTVNEPGYWTEFNKWTLRYLRDCGVNLWLGQEVDNGDGTYSVSYKCIFTPEQEHLGFIDYMNYVAADSAEEGTTLNFTANEVTI